MLAAHGTDGLLLGTGGTVGSCVHAAQTLAAQGLRLTVANVHTIKPFPVEAVVDLARTCGRVVTVEDHNVVGGMGGAVAEALAEHHPVPVYRRGVMDVFGESGTPEELYRFHRLDAAGVVQTVKEALGHAG